MAGRIVYYTAPDADTLDAAADRLYKLADQLAATAEAELDYWNEQGDDDADHWSFMITADGPDDLLGNWVENAEIVVAAAGGRVIDADLYDPEQQGGRGVCL